MILVNSRTSIRLLLIFATLLLIVPRYAHSNKNVDLDEILNADSRVIEGRRVALVIGNADYSDGLQLNNPTNDAYRLAGTLSGLGFKLYKSAPQTNLRTRVDFENVISDFISKIQPSDIVFLYYSGHGVQIEGTNYLVPTQWRLGLKEQSTQKQRLSKEEIIESLYPMDNFWGLLTDSGADNLNIVIVDACRNNPFSGGNQTGRAILIDEDIEQDANGLAAPGSQPQNTWVSYSTSPGAVALDGSSNYGAYTSALVKYLPEPSLDIIETFRRVRAEVVFQTDSSQIPWDSSSVQGKFYFQEGSLASKPQIQAFKENLSNDRDDEYKAIVRLGMAIPLVKYPTHLGKDYQDSSYGPGLYANLGLELPDIDLNHFTIPSPEVTFLYNGPLPAQNRNDKWLNLLAGMLGFKPRLYQGQTTRLQLELTIGPGWFFVSKDISTFLAGHLGAATEFRVFEQAILAVGVGAFLTTADFHTLSLFVGIK